MAENNEKTEEKIIPRNAEQLQEEFKEHSVAEFFKKNKQMLGLYGKVRTLTTIIHEYVTNSIDACEEANILPTIEVKIDELGPEYYEVTVKDNGPGLTENTVGKAFGQLLAGTKFHRMMQQRGQQGIGASGATMLTQTTTGKAVKVITGTGKGKTLTLEITIDPKKNKPKISNLKEINKNYQGTAVQARFKGVLYRESEQGALEYLRRTAIANPHTEILFRDPSGKKIKFKRTMNKIPKAPMAVKPHPKGVTVDEIVTMSKYSEARKTSSFLKNEFDRMGNKAIEEMEKMVNFDLDKDPKQVTWEEAEQIGKAFKTINFIAPRSDVLSPIGEERIKASLKSIVQPEFLTVLTRKPAVYAGGFPFQVEIAIAYGGLAGRSIGGEKRMEIMRFANKAPLLFDAGNCAITKAVQSVEWKRYGVRDVETAPITVLVNFLSVHIPYTGAGKGAIADEDEVMEEIRLALMQSGRRAGVFISRQKRDKENQMKREMFYKYIPEITAALSKITDAKDAELKKKMQKLVLEKLKLDEAEDAKEKLKEDAILKKQEELDFFPEQDEEEEYGEDEE